MDNKAKIHLPPMLGPELWQIRQLASFEEIVVSDEFVFERGKAFSKIKILGSNGMIALSIPLKKHAEGSPFSEIKMDYIQKWQNQIWRSLVSCYKKSPYFDFYERELEKLFYRKPEFLVEYTTPIFHWILRQYFPGKNVSVILSPKSEEKNNLSLLPFSGWVDEETKNEAWNYPQVFGQEFVRQLSVWDAIFCMGPNFGIYKTV